VRIQRLTYASQGDRLYGLDGSRVHVFGIAWQTATAFSSKVRNVKLRFSFELPFRVETLDIDFNEQYIITRKVDDARTLYFFANTEFSEDSASNKIQKETFCLRVHHDIVDFYFAKDEFFARMPFKNFLMVQTTSSFVIYRENERKILQSVFSLPGNFIELNKAKFFLFFQSDSKPENMRGAFFYVKDNGLNSWYLDNLMSKRQVVAVDRHELELEGVAYDRLLTVIIRDQRELLCLFYRNNTFISTINYKLFKSRAGEKVNSLLLVNKHVESPYFIYNQNCSYIYGKLPETLHGFHKYNHKLERKFQFRSLNIDLDKYLRDNFWTLTNDQEFLVISMVHSIVQIFRILANNNVVLLNTLPLQLSEPLAISDVKHVRFSYVNSTKLAFVIETSRRLFLCDVTKKDGQIPILRQFFDLEKSSLLGQEKLDFYQLVFQSVPRKLYRLFILKNPFEVIAYNIDPDKQTIAPSSQITLTHKVHELYKSKRFPYNVIVLDETETLIFLNNNLQIQLSFSLEILRAYLPDKFQSEKFLNNFSFKHMYDRFYLVD
jgi:hypothetical protein